MADKICDHKSVGVLVERENPETGEKELLLIERKKLPFGFAPPAGHIDNHGTAKQAAKDELQEEVGLTVEDKDLILRLEGIKYNPCRRISGNNFHFHYWHVFEALKFSGELKPSPDEAKQAGWYGHDQLLALAQRTRDYLAGKILEPDWQQSPGLEPVWCEMLIELNIVWHEALT